MNDDAIHRVGTPPSSCSKLTSLNLKKRLQEGDGVA